MSVSDSSPTATPATGLIGWRLTAARALSLTFMVLVAATFVLTLDARWSQLTAIAHDNAPVLGALGLPAVTLPAAVVVADTLLMAVYLGIGLLIFLRHSNDRLALFTSIMLTGAAMATVRPSDAVEQVGSGVQVLYLLVLTMSLISISTFLQLFPHSTFTPHWTGWLAVLWGVLIVLWQFAPLGTPIWPPRSPPLWLSLGWIGSGVAIQVYRWMRRSTQAQRQQIKWVVFGFVSVSLSFFVFVYLLPTLLPAMQRPGLPRVIYVMVGVPVFYLSFLVLPIAFAFSILRYRLWDVDRIAHRAMVYSALTTGLVMLYVGCVLILQRLFRLWFGATSVLAIVIATIAIAMAFAPLRRWAQAVIDRRTYRRKYNAAQTLARFNAITRNEVDLDVLTRELLASVSEAMQPEHISLWLLKKR